MKHITVGAALAAVTLALAVSWPGNASADQSGDPGFCLGGWAWVMTGTPTMTETFVVVGEDLTHEYIGPAISTSKGGKWVCQSDL